MSDAADYSDAIPNGEANAFAPHPEDVREADIALGRLCPHGRLKTIPCAECAGLSAARGGAPEPDRRKCAHRGQLLTPGIEAGCLQCACEYGRRLGHTELGYTLSHEEAMRAVEAGGVPGSTKRTVRDGTV